MNNKLGPPPSFKGLDSALAFLAIVKDAKEIEKRMKPVMSYIEEAKEYFDAYNGIEGARKDVHFEYGELEKDRVAFQQERQDFEEALIKHREAVKSYAEKVSEEDSRLDELRRQINNANDQAKRKASELSKNLADAQDKLKDIAEDRKRLDADIEEARRQRERIREAKALLEGDK